MPKYMIVLALLAYDGLVNTLYAQAKRDSPAQIYIQRVDSSQYPNVQIEVLAIERGGTTINDIEGLRKRVILSEDGRKCVLNSLSQITDPVRIAIHVLVDIASFQSAELATLTGDLMNLQVTPEIKADIRLYVQDGESIRRVSSSDLHKRKLDTIPDPALVVASFRDFLKDHKPQFLNHGNLFAFILDSISAETFSSLEADLNSLGEAIPCWFAVLTKKGLTASPSMPLPDKCIFAETVSEQRIELAARLMQHLDPIIHGRFSLNYSVPNIRRLDTHRRYELAFFNETTGEGDKTRDVAKSFGIEFPASAIEATLVQHYMDSSTKLEQSNEYAAALDTLMVGREILESPRFHERAEILIGKYSDWLIRMGKISEASLLFVHAESGWGLSPLKHPWYRDIKATLLEAQLADTSVVKPNSHRALDLCRQLAQLYPGDRNRQAKLLEMESARHLADGMLWEACESMYGALKLGLTPDVRSKLHQTLSRIFKKESEGQNHKTLYERGSKYVEFFAEDFELRHMYAISSLRTNNIRIASEQLEWLLLNWSERVSKIVAWDELFKTLQQSYSQTFRFEDAFSLNQRLFRAKEDGAILSHAVLNLRAKYLAPIIQVFPLFVGRTGNFYASAFDSRQVHRWPHFMNGIYVLSTGGELRMLKGDQKKVRPPTSAELKSISSYPALIMGDTREGEAWLVNRLTSGYAVIDFSVRTDDKEEILLRAVRGKKMLSEPWTQLSEHEETAGIRLMSELLATILAAEYSVSGGISTEAYWAALKSNPLIIYLTLHGPRGETIQNNGFDRSVSVVDTVLWRKSFTALAFMSQIIDVDKKRIIDTSTPIYTSDVWKGAVKLGIVKY